MTTANEFDLNGLPIFVALVEAGSFTKAAERLGCTKTRVSLQIRQLETRLMELITELRLVPTLYVRTDVDLQRNRLIDERDASIRSILNDIKDELKHLRRGARES